MKAGKIRSTMWGRSFVVLGALVIFADSAANEISHSIPKDREEARRTSSISQPPDAFDVTLLSTLKTSHAPADRRNDA